MLILFSANPATYNRSGKVIPQLKDRIGSVIHTHYPRERQLGIEIMEQEAGLDLDGDFPVAVPYFMREIIEQMSIVARRSKYIDQQSGVSARLQHRQLSHHGGQRPAAGGRARRAARRAADQRPGPPLFLVAGQAGTGPDEQPPDVGAAGARRHHGRGHPRRLSRSTSRSTAWPRSPRSFPAA